MAVIFDSTLGEFTVDLFIDESPLLSANFLKLCKLNCYNFSKFNRIEKNYLAEGGYIPSKTDNIGDDYLNQEDASIFTLIKRTVPESKFQALLDDLSNDAVYKSKYINKKTGFIQENINHDLKFKNKGVLAMLKPNFHGSSICISLKDRMEFLDDKLSIIGHISENIEIVDKLNSVLTEDYIKFKPLVPVQIIQLIVLDDPFPDPPGFDLLKPYLFRNITIVQKREISESNAEPTDTQPLIENEIKTLEKLAKSEAKSRAVALEILGDLPDADLTPPDNCIFVCKLNPVTEAEDLELIFSRYLNLADPRFGKILSCDIVYDWKTGDSLQYGFIEFEDSKACEAAIFKMEGTLIDDRSLYPDNGTYLTAIKIINQKHPRISKKYN